MPSTLKSLPGCWQDKTILALGALLFVSPWLLDYFTSANASWNAWIIGVAFMAGGLAPVVYEPYWPEFAIAFTGFWLALSPRILAFSDRPVAYGTAAVIGIAVMVLSIGAALARSRAQREAVAGRTTVRVASDNTSGVRPTVTARSH